jgi:hypothetical protein
MADSVLYRALSDVQSTIQGLSLSGISSANVLLLKSLNDRTLQSLSSTLPAIVIAPLQEELPHDAGLNDRDDITYNIVVAIVAADNQDQSVNYALELNWRENCRRAFHAKRLSPLTTESVVCWIRPQAVIHPDAWYANLFLSMLVIQAVCREVRTPAS